jgi:hypothetical protein
VKFSVFAALAAFAIAQPASAAILELTSTGTLKDGFDQSGRFGTANTDLTGMAYSLVEYFDTSLGLHTDRGALGDNIVGGTGSVTGAPGLASAILTINGISATIYGDFFSYLIASPGATSTGYVSSQAEVGNVETTASVVLNLNPTVILPLYSVFDTFHGDCLGADHCAGGFLFAQTSGSPNVVHYDDHGAFVVESYDLRTLPRTAVPEPATWAMMIVGFGLVGATLRRRAAVAA